MIVANVPALLWAEEWPAVAPLFAGTGTLPDTARRFTSTALVKSLAPLTWPQAGEHLGWPAASTRTLAANVVNRLRRRGPRRRSTPRWPTSPIGSATASAAAWLWAELTSGGVFDAPAGMAYELIFYDDPKGAVPVRDWLRKLSPAKEESARRALTKFLAVDGADVCDTEWGKPVGNGLYEFRVRHDANEILAMRDPALLDKIGPRPAEPTLLRIFFALDGDKIVLLLGGYDKGRHPSKKRQQKEIKTAAKRLAEFKRRDERATGTRVSFRHWRIGRAR